MESLRTERLVVGHEMTSNHHGHIQEAWPSMVCCDDGLHFWYACLLFDIELQANHAQFHLFLGLDTRSVESSEGDVVWRSE